MGISSQAVDTRLHRTHTRSTTVGNRRKIRPGIICNIVIARLRAAVFFSQSHPNAHEYNTTPEVVKAHTFFLRYVCTRFREAVRRRERANRTNRSSQECVSHGREAPPEPRERQGAQARSVRSQEGCAMSENAAQRRTHPRSRSLCRRLLRPSYRTWGNRFRDETSAGLGVGRLAGTRRRNQSRLRRVGGVPATALFQPHERPDELSGRMPEAVAVGGASRVVLEEDDVCVSSARASYNSAPLPSRQQHSVTRV